MSNERGENFMKARGVTRRKFIRTVAVLGAGAAGVSVLAGCGNAGTASLPAGTAGKGEPAAVSPGEAIAATDEVEPNSAVPYTNAETGAQEVLIRLPNEDLVAYSAVCTHQACIVSYQPQTEKLACPCHGGVFDPAKDAAVVSGPPPTPLPDVAFEVRDGKVFLA
ncbi:MAG: Rieske 2Fe-2S domain-containing protein [Rubrobacteraceae bacterium]